MRKENPNCLCRIRSENWTSLIMRLTEIICK